MGETATNTPGFGWKKHLCLTETFVRMRVYKVSVVIPTLNRVEMLGATIDRLEEQTVGREVYEVLVIDNNSSDRTQSLLAQKAAKYPISGFSHS